ncbi:MAG: lactonase family protein [Acidobacteria bacterium]|nr:lactonase family protein [Acidobacteriota bacterium]
MVPLSLAPLTAAVASKGEYLVYIGCYTRGTSKGISVFRFDSGSGKMTPLGLAAETPNPSFLALHPSGKFLYSVSEMGSGGKEGAVSAFSIDKSSGMLTFLNRQSSRGGGPCHLNADKTGRMLVAVNYGTGSVASFPLDAGGKLGEAASFFQHAGSSANPKRQAGPHAHSVNFSPDNRFAIVCDLGLDKIFVYKAFPAKGILTAGDPPFATVKPGSGPRHFAFHPNGKLAFAINEMASTVTSFAWNPGRLREIETVSTLPTDYKGDSSCAEVVVHPSGRFLYGSNRGHDSLAVFSVDSKTGMMTPMGHTPTQGKVPRNFCIDPTGGFLVVAHQNSNSLVVFQIDKATGSLKPAGQTFEIGSPVCVRFLAV